MKLQLQLVGAIAVPRNYIQVAITIPEGNAADIIGSLPIAAPVLGNENADPCDVSHARMTLALLGDPLALVRASFRKSVVLKSSLNDKPTAAPAAPCEPATSVKSRINATDTFSSDSSKIIWLKLILLLIVVW